MRSTRIKISVVLAAVLTCVGALVGASAVTNQATLVQLAGGQNLAKRVITQNAVSTTSSTAFVNVPGAAIAMSVPSGTSRLFDAWYHAESRVTGSAGLYCTVRVVVFNAAGALAELHPQAGTDFAFDSAGSAQDYWEAHAIERSIRLAAGSYRFVVQYRVSGGAASCRLDDWHFAVQQHV